MLRAVLPLVLVATLLAGCGDSAPDAGTTTGGSVTALRAADLDGRSFASTSVQGHRLVPGSQVTVAFDGERLSANAGCNAQAGPWSIADGRLRTDGDLAQTQMACEEPLMRQDDWLRAFLSSAPRVALDGDDLTLAGEAATIELTEAAPRGPRPIVGTSWQLTSLGGRDGTVASVPVGVEPPTLLIEENGDVNLVSGCSRGRGRAEVRDDGFIDFVLIVLSVPGCDRADVRVAEVVEDRLDGRVAAAFDGEGNLVLARRGAQLTFAPTDW
jgi:heat shock protein HslJ